MSYATVPPGYSIILRCQALVEKRIPLSLVIDVLDQATVAGQTSNMICFGPLFGYEAMREFACRLEKIGLANIDDFFEFEGEIPAWLEFSATLRLDQS